MRILYFKKGQGVISNWPFWIMFTVAVGAVGIIIVKIANVNIAEASRIPEDLEDMLVLIPRFYNSEECFAYQDDVGRVHSKSIDQNKFTQANMDKCFPQSDVRYAFSLVLSIPRPRAAGPGTSIVLGPVNTFNWGGGFADKEIIEDVLIFADGNKYDGTLKIGIKNVR